MVTKKITLLYLLVRKHLKAKALPYKSQINTKRGRMTVDFLSLTNVKDKKSRSTTLRR